MRIEFTTRGLLSVCFRQRLIMLAVFVVIVLGGIGYITFATPSYESYGSLLVKFGSNPSEDITRPTAGNTQIISQNDRRELMQANIDILQSHSLLVSVVRDIGVEVIYPGITARVAGKDVPEEAAATRLLKKDLTVKSSQQSNTIDIYVSNANPSVAAQVVSTLFERFIARQSQVFNQPQTEFLAEQVKSSQAKLEESQKKLKDFKAKIGISSIRDELNQLLRQKSDASTMALASPDDAWARLNELQATEAQLLATYRADSPQVRRIRESVALAKQQLNERQSDVSSRTRNATTRIDKRISDLEDQRDQYNDLMRQVEIDEENYKNFQLRSENARINETLLEKSVTPVSVIDQPTTPIKPSKPRRLLILAMCLLAGMVFAVVSMLVIETLDPRFTTPLQVSQVLGVPVMACFPALQESNA